MFTASQLSSFSLLLHYLCVTQTLFGDNPPISSLKNPRASEDKESANTEGCLVSVLQFHRSFIDYCIRLKLANLLYYYVDFYRFVLPLKLFYSFSDKTYHTLLQQHFWETISTMCKFF